MKLASIDVLEFKLGAYLDLSLDARVAHMFLKSGWVALCLLKNALHDRILHDALNLQIVNKQLSIRFRRNLPPGPWQFSPWSARPSRSLSKHT